MYSAGVVLKYAESLANEIDLIQWLLPFLNRKGKEKYENILNQLVIIKG